MAAVNKDPYCYTIGGGEPMCFKGLVRAGSDQAIKVGEICTWNEQTGYFKPVDAVADHQYWLAISKEEQKSTGRAELTGIRYMEFYALHPNDVFEFVLAAAMSLTIGTPFTLTASDSQKLTSGVGAFAVAIAVTDSHYPDEEDTTIRNQSYARVTFNPAISWWGNRMSQMNRTGRKIIAISSTQAIIESDMYHSVILVTGTTVVSLPPVKPGMDAIFQNCDAATIGINPDDDDKIRMDGNLLDDGDSITFTEQGDICRILTESVDGFIALNTRGIMTDAS